MYIQTWGNPTLIATADEINEALSVSEHFDRENGMEPAPPVLTDIATEFDTKFVEVNTS